MASVMLVAIAAATGLNAVLAARGTRERIEARIEGAASIVTGANFPLTENVLRQLQGLSRAEFLLEDSHGEVTASSAAGLSLSGIPQPQPPALARRPELVLEDPVQIGGEEYFHTRLPLRPRGGGFGNQTLHILYPVSEYRAAWQAAVLPSAGVLLVALPVVVVLATTTASRISRRTSRVKDQLHHIARGDFAPVPLPKRNDELRDLAEGVNQTAGMLASYEDQVRKGERMQTLAELGGAVAHQLRNSVTGCRMALDFHTQDCSSRDDESLRVARRQLELMEEYVRRFLQLSKAERNTAFADVDLNAVVEDVLPLVEPAARHAGVQLQWQPPPSPAMVRADRTELGQLLINLVLNGIEAAVRPLPGKGSRSAVRIEVERGPLHPRLLVSDTGPGPGPEVRDRLFEPFVSEKADGVGLGLSVVRTIAAQHGADLNWERADGWTQFRIEFPSESPSKGSERERSA